MSKLGDILNQVHASASAEERLRLLDEGIAEALAWNETDWIYLFAKLAGQVCEKLGELRRAVQYLDPIPLHVGNDAPIYLSLGRICLALGSSSWPISGIDPDPRAIRGACSASAARRPPTCSTSCRARPR